MDYLRKAISRLILFSVLAIILSSCAEAGPHIVDGVNVPYGFWSGYFHGLIAPFTFIVSLFSDNIIVYATNNTGWSYTFGFGFGIIKPFMAWLYLKSL